MSDQPCHSCVEKFVRTHGRKPLKNDIALLNKAAPGCECHECYRESCYATTNMPMPPDYQTFDEAYKILFAR